MQKHENILDMFKKLEDWKKEALKSRGEKEELKKISKNLEDQYEKDIKKLKDQYEEDIENLEEDIKNLKDNIEDINNNHKKEIEQTNKNYRKDKITHNLIKIIILFSCCGVIALISFPSGKNDNNDIITFVTAIIGLFTVSIESIITIINEKNKS